MQTSYSAFEDTPHSNKVLGSGVWMSVLWVLQFHPTAPKNHVRLGFVLGQASDVNEICDFKGICLGS